MSRLRGPSCGNEYEEEIPAMVTCEIQQPPAPRPHVCHSVGGPERRNRSCQLHEASKQLTSLYSRCPRAMESARLKCRRG